MWAICRSDHGLGWAEFQSLTLAQFEALEERRMVDARRSRFNAGLITSTIYNAHRGPDSEAITVWDFLPGFDRDPEAEEADELRKSIKHAIAVSFTERTFDSPEDAQAEKARTIERMRANGVEDPEQLFCEVFPEM